MFSYLTLRQDILTASNIALVSVSDLEKFQNYSRRPSGHLKRQARGNIHSKSKALPDTSVDYEIVQIFVSVRLNSDNKV